MTSEGKIEISVKVPADGSSVDVHLQSSRPANLAKFLVGKKPQQAAEILPMIFSVCGMAHRAAATQACGDPSQNECVRNELLVLAENAREHGLRISMGWGENAEAARWFMSLLADMKNVIEGDLNQVIEFAGRLQDGLQKHVFGMDVQNWLALSSDKALKNWARETDTIAAISIRNIYLKGWQAVGRAEVNFLPKLEASQLMQMMNADGFAEQPNWHGAIFETGPLARNYEHGLIADLAFDHGYGLLVRKVARLVELAKIPEQILNLTAKDGTGLSDNSHPKGFGQVETARGQLTHCVKVRDDEIINYQILAPTEWNFHPRGVVKAALENVYAQSPKSDFEELSGMIVDAIDPCVSYEVRVN